MSLSLRPHHALCIRFFEGKGYSEAFILHMTSVIEALQRDDPTVTLCGGCDILCAECPHNKGGVCDHDEKVRGIDERTLELTELSVGDALPWHELYTRAYDSIIKAGRLKEVCRDCQWLNICISKSKR